MKVVDLMKTEIITVTLETPLHQVWQIIFSKRLHGLPVTDKDKKLLGIISEEDLLRKLYPDLGEAPIDFDHWAEQDEEIITRIEKIEVQTADEIMNPRVIFTRPDTHVMRALSRMIVRKVRQLPVVNDNDKLIGMISKGDIFDMFFRRNIKRKIRDKITHKLKKGDSIG